MSTKVLKRLIDKQWAPAATVWGFAGKGRLHKRTAGDAVHVLEIVLWKYNDATSARFTVELGVVFPALLQAIASIPSFSYYQPFLANPTITECAARQRIGSLMPAREDTWWTVTPSTDPATVADEVVSAVRTYGLPWFEPYTGIAAFAARTEEAPGVFEIAAHRHLGRREAAEAAFASYAQRAAAFPERLAEIRAWLER